LRKKMTKLLLVSGLVLVGIIVVALVYRVLRQHHNAAALVINTPNGIREEMFIQVGGIEQWVQIRGEDRGNPVLMFLHGGPGFSCLALTPVFRRWEKYFTVLYCTLRLFSGDQRGAGKTYGRNGGIGNGTLTIDRMTQDGIEVAEFVRKHLNKDKVILFAHSWGTVLGLPMVSHRPDLFYAYAGTGQVVNMERNEAVSYQLIRQRIVVSGDQRTIRALDEIGPPPYEDVKTWMMKGRLIVMNSPPPTAGHDLPDVFSLALFSPNYSLKDAYHLFSAVNYSCSTLYAEMMSNDARRLGTTFEAPIFILQGDSDFQSPTALVTEYFSTIQAPKKELVLLKGEGHTAVLSNPDLFLDELVSRVRLLGVQLDPTATKP